MRLMRIEQAMVYVLVTSGRGMTAMDIARYINDERLHVRYDGEPVSDRQIYAVACRNNQIFVREGGLIRLLM